MTPERLLKFEEGYRSKPYLCSEGYPTVGIGQRIGDKGTDINVFDFVVPESVALQWCKETVFGIERELKRCDETRDAYFACNPARQGVLISMAYQMGVNGLRQFKKTLQAVAQKDFKEASKEMLDSRWAKQSLARARRHADQMLTGDWFKGY